MNSTELNARLNFAIDKGNIAIRNKQYSEYNGSHYVSQADLAAFNAVSRALIAQLYGENHAYYLGFVNAVDRDNVRDVEAGLSILDVIKHEVANGWLVTFRTLVSAEIFTDFLDMAQHLLEEKYKDPAAVMTGSVLEEHLRQLCQKNKINTTVLKGTDNVPKKADQLNVDLVKAGIYTLLDQKSITAWLDLRNKAAHGKYGDYTIEQVQLMYQGVLNFISRTQ
ncbi:hypothetical protein [Hymenobacter sp. BT190]|uniref:hypothetical protein n=1 Tax=Hymenobacter sp. BT190 TaxID=2763505 RepID=UPI001650D7E2|nr:hypothetical protein [Hymenobacter sp. BT190]MBC6698906.1 hypothetical protein [Hymenobacter sp. BT190]